MISAGDSASVAIGVERCEDRRQLSGTEAESPILPRASSAGSRGDEHSDTNDASSSDAHAVTHFWRVDTSTPLGYRLIGLENRGRDDCHSLVKTSVGPVIV